MNYNARLQNIVDKWEDNYQLLYSTITSCTITVVCTITSCCNSYSLAVEKYENLKINIYDTFCTYDSSSLSK